MERQNLTFTPVKPRRNPSDMPKYLYDGQRVRCRGHYIGVYIAQYNSILYNGVHYRSLGAFSKHVLNYNADGWNRVKKEDVKGRWIAITSSSI